MGTERLFANEKVPMTWVFNTGGFNGSIDALIRAVDQATSRGVTSGAELIADEAKESFGPAHAKGTPKTVFDKPQSITGNLRRSIRQTGSTTSPSQGVWMARVGPTAIYGRRIELGFKGADSLGRVYNQPKYPYFKPGVDKALTKLNRVFEAVWAYAMKV